MRPSTPLMRCGRKPMRPLVTMPMPEVRHVRQARHVVAQVVLGHEADLEAAPVLVDVLHEGLREVRRHVAGHAALARGLRLERVHDVRDVDLLGAAHGAEVAGDAHPGRVAVHDPVAGAGPDEREDLAGRVVHVPLGRARSAARAALDAGLQARVGRDGRDDLFLEGRRAPPSDRWRRWRDLCLGHRVRLVCSNARGPCDGDRGRDRTADGPEVAHDSGRRTPGGVPPVARAIRLTGAWARRGLALAVPNRPHRRAVAPGPRDGATTRITDRAAPCSTTSRTSGRSARRWRSTCP